MKKDTQIFILFFLLFSLLTNPEVFSWNDSSRMATIQSLVEYHSFIIDNSQFVNTGDKYFYQGHFYSDKPPILAIFGSIFYFILRIVGISFRQNQNLTYYLLTLIVIGGTTCFGLVYFAKTLRVLKVNEPWANVVLLVTGTGTLILPYSTVFNNHSVSGSLLIIGFYYLLKMQENVINSFIVGFLITLAGSIDITNFLFIPFFAIAVLDKPIKSKMAFLLPCVMIIVIYLFINVYTSGTLTPPAANKALWNYPGSAFSESSLSGLAHYSGFSLLKYAFHMLLGNRGLISYTPILVFSIFGFAKVLLKKQFKYRREYLLIFIALCTYILIYIFRSVDYSGDCYGVRWYTSVMFLSRFFSNTA